MHELAVTEDIIKIVTRHAQDAGAQHIIRINLVIGELASIVDDSVQFYFDYLAQNTVAEGAQLSFERLPVKVRCGACEHTWVPSDADWTCPACGQACGACVQGREFFVDSIEVE